jgi:hypothetical protein
LVYAFDTIKIELIRPGLVQKIIPLCGLEHISNEHKTASTDFYIQTQIVLNIKIIGTAGLSSACLPT